ncbi:MAG: helix-turn-helix domain-containing protein [Acetatifactor sp.]|nr:helix-turn-helix domain-containing protein [Acetatifactor sp.]MDE7044519.1 helix-turn-helix domain-containing protein [Acetatifactor sp.]
MVEFGEKIKHFREEKGMTQQTMAESLYVTRQAVSRWECGARYPDLLTAKKIAKILDVSLDELLSGEELKEQIEKEPVLAQPIENVFQTVLYTAAAIIYLLLCIFSLYSYIAPNEALSNSPAGKITVTTVSSDIIRITYFAAAVSGLVLSVKNKMNAKITGYIMCVPYLSASLSFLITYIDMRVKNNGHIDFMGWLTDFTIPLIFGTTVILYFEFKERRIPFLVILAMCILVVFHLLYVYKCKLSYFTDLGFVVTTVGVVGKSGMAVLLGYQAYVWDKKKRIAYKKKIIC